MKRFRIKLPDMPRCLPRFARRTFIIAAFTGASLAAAATTANAVELKRGPFLLQSLPDGITVRWRTDTSSAGPALVRYGSSIDKLDQAVLAIEVPSPGKEARDWSAKLTGLTPETKYFYSVEVAAVTLAGADNDHWFRTSPPKGAATEKLRFWCLGDAGSNRARPTKPEDALKPSGLQPAIAVRNGFRVFNGDKPLTGILQLGDNANPKGTDLQYSSAFFQTYARELAHTPLFPCNGNHDMEKNVYGRTFAVGEGSVLSESNVAGPHYPFYYSADVGNIHLVILDPWWSWWVKNTDENHRPWRQQMDWLNKDLASTRQDWIVVANHFPVYCDGNYNSDGGNSQLSLLRKDLVPLFDRYGVDLCLTGHDHTYQRSYLISGHLGDSNTFDPQKHLKSNSDGRQEPIVKRFGPESGTLYIVHGAAGGGRPGGRFEHPVMVPMPAQDGKVKRGIVGPGSFVFEVEGLTLHGWAIDAKGKVVDAFSVEKKR